MMGHLVFGRYGSQDAVSIHQKNGWMRRLWRNLFARTPARPG